MVFPLKLRIIKRINIYIHIFYHGDNQNTIISIHPGRPFFRNQNTAKPNGRIGMPRYSALQLFCGDPMACKNPSTGQHSPVDKEENKLKKADPDRPFIKVRPDLSLKLYPSEIVPMAQLPQSASRAW
jgi:hypothetical protein